MAIRNWTFELLADLSPEDARKVRDGLKAELVKEIQNLDRTKAEILFLQSELERYRGDHPQ